MSNQTDRGDFLKVVPPHLLAILQRKQLAYRAHVLATRPEYPDPADLPFMDTEEVLRRGFTGHALDGLLGFELRKHDLRKKGRRGHRQSQGTRKSKGESSSSKSGVRGKTLPNPFTIADEVSEIIKKYGLQSVQGRTTGPIVQAEQNLLFGNEGKINYYALSFQQLIPLANIWGLVEVAPSGVAAFERLTGYTGICSKENNRDQAVGFLIDTDRLKIRNSYSINEVANVQGIADLRPALVVELEDRVTGEQFWKAVIHLKSMRGGERVTAAVRYQQCQILAEKLSGKGSICGDWNCKLPDAPEVEPLREAGFVLLDETSTEETHSMGSRLDGIFTIGLPAPLGEITLIPWFKLLSCGRSFTDHAALFAES